MILLQNLFWAGFAGFAFARGPSVPPPTYENSAVIDLVPKNFDKLVLDGKPALVEFFAPWCGHCKNLAPTYEQLALDFEFAKDKVIIAKVDADAEKDLGKRFGVQGFPTLKWFDGKSDKPEDYNGGRDLDSLTEFITQKTGVRPKKPKKPESQVQMLNDQTFAETIGSDKDVLVAFTAPWCGHCKSLAPTWEKVALDYINEPGVVIAKVDAEAENAKATAKDQGVSSYPTIKFFPKGSKVAEPYESGRTEADILEWVNSKAGTHRMAGGGLDATAGTIEALDTIVAKLTGGSSIAEVAAEATAAVKSLKEGVQNKYAEYYVKVFEKLGKNDGYASKELSRLDGILKKGGLAPAKLDEMTSKTNILRKFLGLGSTKDEL